MLDKLKSINNSLLEETKGDSEKQKLHELIGKLLDEPNVFLKIDMETAYAILRDLNIPEDQLNTVYCELLEPTIDNK